MDIGGGTKYRNDILLDGTPLTAGNKLGYTPPMDAVSRVHGPAELGRRRVRPQRGRHRHRHDEVGHERGPRQGLLLRPQPEPERGDQPHRRQQHNENPYWNAGGTVGLPIKKNKLFLFAVFEEIENTQSVGRQLHAADGARAAGRLLAVLQRRRHACA